MQALYALDDEELLKYCRSKQVTSSGPGGQHAQKNATACQLHEPNFNIEVRCQDFRSLEANRKRALKEMRIRLAVAQRGCADMSWLKTVQQGARINCSNEAKSYPLVIACLLDQLSECSYVLPCVAQKTGASSSQILSCLKRHKYVWQAVQSQRQNAGLGKLH